VKTPLRYPGGKSRAVKKILPYIQDLGGGELCSPFLGGASVELACAEQGMTVHGYDLFSPLVWFWEALLMDSARLTAEVESLREPVRNYTSVQVFGDWWGKECSGTCKITSPKLTDSFCNEHKRLQMVYNGEILGATEKTFHFARKVVNRSAPANLSELFEYAANYYIVNCASFSGAATSGGWSWRASWDRLTDSKLERLRNFSVPNFTVKRADFKDAILAHPDAIIYADPPYALNKSGAPGESNKETLYGCEGDLHGGFDHEGLAKILHQRTGWVLSYSNCSYIRELYDGYDIYDEQWAYGMGNVNQETMKESSEIIIVG